MKLKGPFKTRRDELTDWGVIDGDDCTIARVWGGWGVARDIAVALNAYEAEQLRKELLDKVDEKMIAAAKTPSRRVKP